MGKKKFIDVKEKHEDLLKRGDVFREKFIDLIDKDAEYFEPLSKAYVMSSNTEEEKKQKEEKLQKCLKDACSAPIISDVGVGVQCLKAALNSAYLNVLINLNSITDIDYVAENKHKAEKLLVEGNSIADEVYTKVINIINK
jgi:formiminotetrahydrofolate cyclodeaminase